VRDVLRLRAEPPLALDVSDQGELVEEAEVAGEDPLLSQDCSRSWNQKNPLGASVNR
jgi:hypothetical protein